MFWPNRCGDLEQRRGVDAQALVERVEVVLPAIERRAGYRIVDQHVAAAGPRDDLGVQRLDRGIRREIERQGGDVVAARPLFRCHRLELGDIARGDEGLRAGLGQRGDDLPAIEPGPAGDQRDLALEARSCRVRSWSVQLAEEYAAAALLAAFDAGDHQLHQFARLRPRHRRLAGAQIVDEADQLACGTRGRCR